MQVCTTIVCLDHGVVMFFMERDVYLNEKDKIMIEAKPTVSSLSFSFLFSGNPPASPV